MVKLRTARHLIFEPILPLFNNISVRSLMHNLEMEHIEGLGGNEC